MIHLLSLFELRSTKYLPDLHPSILLNAAAMTGSLLPEWQIWYSSLPEPPKISPSEADP